MDFNSYGSRRGNHEVMMRGTFANIRIKNQMVPGVEGGFTIHQPSGDEMPSTTPPCATREEKVPLVIFAGKEYGTGSSRDWAAKGTRLLGVRAVIAESFERIHRSNLVGMGVLPLVFKEGTTWKRSSSRATRRSPSSGLADGLKPRQTLTAEIALATAHGHGAAHVPHRYARRARILHATAASCTTCCASSPPEAGQGARAFRARRSHPNVTRT